MLFIRNLQLVYRVLEEGLERHRSTPGVRLLVRPETYRLATLEADLVALSGAGWANDLPLVPEALAYATAIENAVEGSGAELIAHAYVRTLGDLSGGQTLARLLRETLGLPEAGLGFYRFDAIPDLAAYRMVYRGWLNEAGTEIDCPDLVVQAAVDTFRFSTDLSVAIARLISGRHSPFR